MEKKLMELFTKFNLTDIFGFAKIVGVEQDVIKRAVVNGAGGDKDYEEIICCTVERFSGKTRKERRQLIKLAKEIVKDNLAAATIKQKD